jgi:hypothetical protein
LSRSRFEPFSQQWSKHCSWCNTDLLSTERDGWCCMKGKYPPPRLPPCDDLLLPLQQRHENHLSRMSRVLNEGFTFSALQATGRFVPFQGPANVVLEGRVYHQIRDVLNPDGRPAHVPFWLWPIDKLNTIQRDLDPHIYDDYPFHIST